MKRILGVALCLSLCFATLAGCGGSPTAGKNVDAAAKQAIEDAAKKLNSTYSNYIISNTVEFSDGVSEFIEVIKGDDIYTEYSVSEDGNLGEISYGSTDSIQYALMDWTHDNQYYSYGYTEDGEMLYKFPSNFATKYVHDREMLWANRILAGAIEVEAIEDMQLTLNGAAETFKAYRVRVTPDTVLSLLGSGSWGVYNSLKDEEKAGTNISKMCDFYLESTALENTYSEGVITFAVDQDGILRFMSLETGGLGHMMYYTKAVVDTRNQNVRDMPDFSDAVPLAATMTEMADFLAQYPDYDSAIQALNDIADYDPTEDVDGQDLIVSGGEDEVSDGSGSEGSDGSGADEGEGSGAEGDEDASPSDSGVATTPDGSDEQ